MLFSFVAHAPIGTGQMLPISFCVACRHRDGVLAADDDWQQVHGVPHVALCPASGESALRVITAWAPSDCFFVQVLNKDLFQV
jgi:hypothetical protein